MSIEFTIDQDAAALNLIDFGQLWQGRADTFEGEDEVPEVDRRQFFSALFTAFNVPAETIQESVELAESLNSSGLENPVDVVWPTRFVGRVVTPGTDVNESLNALLVELPDAAENPSLVVVTDLHTVCKLSLADDSETEVFPVETISEKVEDFMLLAEEHIDDDDEEEDDD